MPFCNVVACGLISSRMAKVYLNGTVERTFNSPINSWCHVENTVLLLAIDGL
jgi:hypothetical protein